MRNDTEKARINYGPVDIVCEVGMEKVLDYDARLYSEIIKEVASDKPYNHFTEAERENMLKDYFFSKIN
ncbi:hypothetical protein V7127_25720 [Bacillus sp. JJ1773]|uniref:hypothetical protein n=1 Tax=Bacillus sp. JJ1773 TaxID=3122965 RepID=UPI003000EA94